MRIKTKLSLFLLTSLSFFLYLSYKAYSNYKNYSQLTEQIQLSYNIQSDITEILQKPFSKSSFLLLKKRRTYLDRETRQLALSHFIQSYSQQNKFAMIRTYEFFKKNEREYLNYSNENLKTLKKKVETYTGLSFLCALLFMIFTNLYIKKLTLTRIHSLYKRMLDFLNYRYTYQFTTPNNDEIGLLQGTFNSLAQRVLYQVEELKSLDKAKSEFLSIASHELRTPLTSIKGSLGLLNSGVVGTLNEAEKNLVNIAENETNRLIRLINDLLDLAKIEAKKFPLDKKWVSLQEIIDNTFSGLSGLCKTAKVQLVNTSTSLFRIYADKDRIHQILTNLISNAIKFSPENGQILIHSEVKDSLLYVSVTDQGPGISPEDQEVIFQQFRQVTSVQNPLVKGTGLGLAISKALIEEHNGHISVFSKLNSGSCFYFTLPQWELENSILENSNQESTEVFSEGALHKKAI